MASNPKIEVEITADASKLRKGAADAEKAVGNLGDSIGKTAKDKLGPMGDALEKVGVDLEGMGNSGLVAAAGVAAVGKFVADGVGKINQMTDEVRKFKAASGESWESASRFVAIADDLGVSAEQVASGVNKLAKAAAGGELEKFGLEAVRAKDGTIDMGATLAMVADAMNNTHDQAKKAAMGTALLGKSWVDLNPLLEQGSAGIKEAMAGVKGYQIVTEESAAKQREMALAMDDLHDSISGLQMAFAKDFVPEIAKGASQLASLVDALNSATSKVGGFHNVVTAVSGPMGVLSDHLDDTISGFKDLIGQGDKAEPAIVTVGTSMAATALQAGALAAGQRDAATASKEQEQALAALQKQIDASRAAVEAQINAELAAEQAQWRLSDSAKDLAVKQAAVTAAVNEYGPASAEAMAATDEYNRAITDAKGTAVDAAQAQANLAIKTMEAGGETASAKDKADAFSTALAGVASATQNGDLRSGLDNLVGQVQSAASAADNAQSNYNNLAASIGRAAFAAATASFSAALSGGDAPPRAGGGPVSAGQAYTVGEQGTELFVPQQSGTIIPNGKLGAGGGDTYVVNVTGAVGNQDDLMRYIHDGLRRLERSKR